MTCSLLNGNLIHFLSEVPSPTLVRKRIKTPPSLSHSPSSSSCQPSPLAAKKKKNPETLESNVRSSTLRSRSVTGMRHVGYRRNRISLQAALLVGSILTGSCLFFLGLRSIEPDEPVADRLTEPLEPGTGLQRPSSSSSASSSSSSSCATVEQMGDDSAAEGFEKESLRVRKLIRDHFQRHGISLLIDPSLFLFFFLSLVGILSNRWRRAKFGLF